MKKYEDLEGSKQYNRFWILLFNEGLFIYRQIQLFNIFGFIIELHIMEHIGITITNHLFGVRSSMRALNNDLIENSKRFQVSIFCRVSQSKLLLRKVSDLR